MASIFSEEAETRAEEQSKREKEREERALKLRDTKARVKKYDRLRKANKTKDLGDKKLKRFLKTSDSVAQHAARKAARSELLLQEEPGHLEAEGMEKTYKFKQEDIAAAVPLANSKQFFELKLDTFGPYSINYSQNGRHLLIGGHRGHLATFDWGQKDLGCEFHVYQTVRDVQFLHNEMMFAAAQKKYVFVYDHTGMELHCLKQQREVHRLTFLPYHFLLVAADDHGGLHYLDTSTGRPVASIRTGLGSLQAMTQNPHNAIIHLGHHSGAVSLWSPSVRSPLIKIQCHKAPITDLAVERGGWTMVTVGMDAKMKVWDIRSTYKELHSRHTYRPAASVCVSQRGLVAVGRGRTVEVWRDLVTTGGTATERLRGPYLTHQVRGEVSCLQFCPFEDCLGIGHINGFTSVITPGAGEANFDALESNPFQTKQQRQEEEVKRLLEKVPAELITLDPAEITKVHHSEEDHKKKDKQVSEEVVSDHVKRKTRGRGTLAKTLQKKEQLKETKRREARREQVREMEEKKAEEERGEKEGKQLRTKHVLDRFR